MAANDSTDFKPHVLTPDTKRQQAFIDAVSLLNEYVRRRLYAMTGNEDLAKDLAQQTWLAVYHRFKTENFTKKGLLKRKAWQTFMSYCRASKTRSFVEYTDNIDEIAPPCSPRKEGEAEEAAVDVAEAASGAVDRVGRRL